jgi:hypothetical protein
MESLFNKDTANGILERLEKLQPDSKPLWGKMSVSQMIAHCEAPLNVALGITPLKQSFLGLLFGRIAKRQLLKPEPFKKSLPTAPEFVIKSMPDFTTEKENLKSLIKCFAATEPTTVSSRAHPFFGKMTSDEWGFLQWKHLDHHLRQFGV